MGERKGIRWLLPVGGANSKVKQVGVRRGQNENDLQKYQQTRPIVV
jgi:hypothetical protein